MQEESAYIYGAPEAAPGMRVSGHIKEDRFKEIREVASSRRASCLYSAIRHGRRYLLKALSEEHKANPGYMLALEKEFEIGISLDHPNIRATYGMEKVEGIGDAIIMEYVDGETLGEALARGRVGRDNARVICRQIAEALSYLHAKQIFHRDLKPSNIMITANGGVVKLIDLGMSDGGGYVVLKQNGGTKQYMAPELRRGEASATVESDLWSMGRIMEEIAEVAQDEELEEMSKRCLRENPLHRPGSVAMSGLLDMPLVKRVRLFSPASESLTYLLVALNLLAGLGIILLNL